jgi:hypothetical protein
MEYQRRSHTTSSLSQVSAVVGIINHFIFKALIFWEKVKFSLVFENYIDLLL